jgi:hypothetical protein
MLQNNGTIYNHAVNLGVQIGFKIGKYYNTDFLKRHFFVTGEKNYFNLKYEI